MAYQPEQFRSRSGPFLSRLRRAGRQSHHSNRSEPVCTILCISDALAKNVAQTTAALRPNQDAPTSAQRSVAWSAASRIACVAAPSLKAGKPFRRPALERIDERRVMPSRVAGDPAGDALQLDPLEDAGVVADPDVRLAADRLVEHRLAERLGAVQANPDSGKAAGEQPARNEDSVATPPKWSSASRCRRAARHFARGRMMSRRR